jgi:hypothetical protein
MKLIIPTLIASATLIGGAALAVDNQKTSPAFQMLEKAVDASYYCSYYKSVMPEHKFELFQSAYNSITGKIVRPAFVESDLPKIEAKISETNERCTNEILRNITILSYMNIEKNRMDAKL